MSDASAIPRVTAIIPVHNRPEELTRAIRSVLNQTLREVEILVMDDASSVDLKPVCDAFKDARIRFFKSEKKSNANVQRNRGIHLAQGEFVAFLDSDDEWLPDHLTLKVSELIDRKADGVYGSSFIDDGKSKKYVVSREIPSNLHPVEFLLSVGFANTSSYIVRTSAAKMVMFDETLHRHQDFDFFSRFALSYNFLASWKPTIVIHWKEGEVRQKHATSEIRFIQQNFQNIQPKIYVSYHLKRLYAWRLSGEKEVISHYKSECLRYINHLAFVQFCSIYPERKGLAGFVVNWLSFTFLLVKVKFFPAKAPALPQAINDVSR
jgi:glycosyltransferase involved in cell wall biosynthesis